MGIRVGSKVRAGGQICEVQEIHPLASGDTLLSVVRPDGYRQVWDLQLVELMPEDSEKKLAHRQAVDRILVYGGVPRDYLYEYPYNERQSDQILAKAEKLLDDLLEILDTNGRAE